MKKTIIFILALIVVVIAVFLLLIGFLYNQIVKEPSIPERAWLKIEINGQIVEMENSIFSKALSIRDLWFHLQRAKIDRRIEGIFLRINNAGCGFATIAEMGSIFQDFRRCGKKIIAFIETAELKEYYLASFADKIFVLREGLLFLRGPAMESLFLKQTLEKLDIKAEFYHIGAYKTASNIFTEDHMTPEHQESYQQLITDVFASTCSAIAANRRVPVEKVLKIITDPPATMDQYQKEGLVDGIMYEDEVWSGYTPDPEYLKFQTYANTTDPNPFSGGRKIAILFASGEINSGESGGQSLTGREVMGAHTISRYLKLARQNPLIQAVILRVDSPGGSAIASDIIRREAELLMKEKPLVVSMGDLAASGGYMISTNSSKILAHPQTITGSIGVLGGKFILKGFYDKIGVKKDIVKTTPHSDMMSDYREFSPQEREMFEYFLKTVYDSFIGKVAKGRKLKLEEVDAIAQGRVWSGVAARKLKLTDQMGGINEAILEAKKLARIPAAEKIGIVMWPREKGLVDTISDLINTASEKPIEIRILEKFKRFRLIFPALMLPFQIQFQ